VGLVVQRLLGVVLLVDVEFPEEVVAMILTDATAAAITRARQFVEECGASMPGDRRQLREAWRKLMGLGDASSPGTAELHLMQIAQDFAEAVVELADGTSIARAPTQATVAVIAAARRIAAAEVVVEFTREDLARAIVELAGARPNKIDAARADFGDWDRSAGDAVCASCELPLYDHPVVPGIEWLRRRCNGRLVKL
jgi:hypothetical protein